MRQVLVTGAERPNLWVDVGAHLDDGPGRAPMPREPARRLGRRRGARPRAGARGRGAGWSAGGPGVPVDHAGLRRAEMMRGRGGHWGGDGAGPPPPAGHRRTDLPPDRRLLPAIPGPAAGHRGGDPVTATIGVVNPILIKLVIDNLARPAGPGPALPPVRTDDRPAVHHQPASASGSRTCRTWSGSGS